MFLTLFKEKGEKKMLEKKKKKSTYNIDIFLLVKAPIETIRERERELSK
jgi:hypothetical protein